MKKTVKLIKPETIANNYMMFIWTSIWHSNKPILSFSGGSKITIKGKGFLDVGEVRVNNLVSYRSHQMDVV
jgi:hypothetical protein